jgi:hypothetical protein
VEEDTQKTLAARQHFAAALREVRRRYGLETGQGKISQKRFAEMLGISGDRPEERYGLYEKGKREPPLWILASLRRVTGFSLCDMIAQLPAGRPLRAVTVAPHRKHPPSDTRPTNQPRGQPQPHPLPGGRVQENRASGRAQPRHNGASRRAGD